MRCSSCRRIDRAVFARLLPGRTYVVLCGGCLDHINEQIQYRLRHRSPAHVRHTNLVREPHRPPHLLSRFTNAFTAPVRKLVSIRTRLNDDMMNKDQWRGGLKQLQGALKKRWGRWTGDTVLETTGEIERLLGVFQRQYGHLKARERREHRRDGPHEITDGMRQDRTSLVLIQGRKHSRHTPGRMRPASPKLQRI